MFQITYVLVCNLFFVFSAWMTISRMNNYNNFEVSLIVLLGKKVNLPSPSTLQNIFLFFSRSRVMKEKKKDKKKGKKKEKSKKINSKCIKWEFKINLILVWDEESCSPLPLFRCRVQNKVQLKENVGVTFLTLYSSGVLPNEAK